MTDTRVPHHTTGMLIRRLPDGRPQFAGTCFALWSPNHLLTAAHCVKGAAPADFSVSIYDFTDGVQHGFPVTGIRLHPTADAAVLSLDAKPGNFDPFHSVLRIRQGAEVAAFGYPEDSGESGLVPTPRLFRGYVQRSYRHRSHLGYDYLAYELSIAVPSGLSGGPVYPVSSSYEVAAIAVENRYATTRLHTFLEYDEDNVKHVEREHEVVQYGIVVALSEIDDWLKQVIPRRPAA